MTVGAGVLILLLSVAAALGFGNHITRQVKQLTDAASRLKALDLAQAPVVPDSRIRELAHAGAAFNAMTGALQQFEMYVPKSLVLRLMRRGGPSAAGSQLRDVTVMFTDIRGFRAMAERLSADETADVGLDNQTPVANDIGAGRDETRFTGSIKKITLDVKDVN